MFASGCMTRNWSLESRRCATWLRTVQINRFRFPIGSPARRSRRREIRTRTATPIQESTRPSIAICRHLRCATAKNRSLKSFQIGPSRTTVPTHLFVTGR